jgi:hypothetical protein
LHVPHVVEIEALNRSRSKDVRQSQIAPEYFDEGALIGVLTAEPLDRMLDYKAPEGGCHLGAFVEVPLGPRKVIGVVWGAGNA